MISRLEAAYEASQQEKLELQQELAPATQRLRYASLSSRNKHHGNFVHPSILPTNHAHQAEAPRRKASRSDIPGGAARGLRRHDANCLWRPNCHKQGLKYLYLLFYDLTIISTSYAVRGRLYKKLND